MKYIKTILIILNIIFFINSFHFGFFAIFPFFKKKNIEKKESNIKHKFMILIAARNEEKVIGNLIDSLLKQNYDKSLYKICVIPNNCTDNTKEIAINKKCLIIEPDFTPKTKGEVLNYSLNYFKNDKSFDTYVIFDADNVVDKNFLYNINNKLNKGYKIVQGFRDTKNLYQNYLSGSYALFFYLQNLFLYESRNRINEGSTINGTGYAVSKDYIDTIKYKSKTITEDIELTCICAINHEKIGYEDKAIFYDEQVANFKTSMKQRHRWVKGCIQVFKYHYKDLLVEMKNHNCFQLIDMFQITFLPINQICAFIVLLLTYLFVNPFNLIVIGLSFGYVGQVFLSVFLILHYKKNIKKLISACLFFPIFNLTWLPLYIYSIFNTNTNWDQIKHTNSMKIEEILEE